MPLDYTKATLLEPTPLYAWEVLEGGVQIDEDLRKCVVFVGTEAGGRFTPLGTGFIGSLEYQKDVVFRFVVTAKHVIDSIAGEIVSVRFNRNHGPAQTIPIEKRGQIWTKQAANDIAFLPVNPGHDVFNYKSMPLTAEHWKKAREDFWPAGPGDEVCMVGLYTSHYGEVHNIPVVRIGHIAAMPGEPVRTDKGYLRGFLIEVHSIAGLSGSPVFLNAPIVRIREGGPQFANQQLHYPIGILIGHHVIETKEDEIIVPQFQETKAEHKALAAQDSDLKRTGFGVVVPIDVVFDAMRAAKMQEILKMAYEHHMKKSGFAPQSASVGTAAPSTHSPQFAPQRKNETAAGQSSARAASEAPAADNPRHKEDFTNLLRAASKGRKRGRKT